MLSLKATVKEVPKCNLPLATEKKPAEEVRRKGYKRPSVQDLYNYYEQNKDVLSTSFHCLLQKEIQEHH